MNATIHVLQASYRVNVTVLLSILQKLISELQQQAGIYSRLEALPDFNGEIRG